MSSKVRKIRQIGMKVLKDVYVEKIDGPGLNNIFI